MKVLLKQVRIIDPASPLHRSQQDILIDNGFIRKIAGTISDNDARLVQAPGLYASPGWTDIFAHFCDPGFEYRETLQTGAAAAAAGGFTTVLVAPNTKPVIDNKAQVEYIVRQSAILPVKVLPLGAVTRGAEGKELAEMYDMRQSGAIAFSDGLQPVQSAGILLKALQYVKAFQGVVVQIPDDKSIAPHGLINEGIISTQLGLPGKPAMAEELIVARDIKLVRYTGSRLHFTGVSSPKSLEYIRRAKDAGLQVTCSVTPYHLVFCDEDLAGYDTNLKVNPPLRTRDAMLALRSAVMDGTVDCIASHHIPQDYDSKVCEFEYAKFGMTGLETSYSVIKTALPDISEEQCVQLLSTNAGRIFGLEKESIRENVAADITLFQSAHTYTFTSRHIKSKSSNTAFTGRQLTGRPYGIINGDKTVLYEE